jgi:hypothetical protein
MSFHYEFDYGYEEIPNEMIVKAKWVRANRHSQTKRLRECRHNLPYLLWVDLMRLVLKEEALCDSLEGVVWRFLPPDNFFYR